MSKLVSVTTSRPAAHALRMFAAAASTACDTKITMTTAARLAVLLTVGSATETGDGGVSVRHFDRLYKTDPDRKQRTTLKLATAAKTELDSFAGVIQQIVGVRITTDRAIMHACRVATAQLGLHETATVKALAEALDNPASTADAAALIMMERK